jgi:hypothetical protein
LWRYVVAGSTTCLLSLVSSVQCLHAIRPVLLIESLTFAKAAGTTQA